MLKKLINSIVFLLVFIMYTTPAFAEPKIVTNTQLFIKDALDWLLLLLPTGGALAFLLQVLQKMWADGDQTIIQSKNRNMRNILIGIAIGESVVGIVDLVATYYK